MGAILEILHPLQNYKTMTQDTKNKFAAMLSAANKVPNVAAKVEALEIKVNDTVKYKNAVITAKVDSVLKDYINAANITFEDGKKEVAAIEDLQKVELSEMTFNDLIPSEPIKAQRNLTVVNYSDKAIAVIGDTYNVKEILKRIGGRFNYNLTCGAGWIFSKAKADVLRKELNLNFVL